jgi:hypothetical protein
MTQGKLFSAVATSALVAVGCGILTGPDDSGRLSIQRFTASPDEINTGAKTVLLWSVDGAEAVNIDQGIGEVEASGSMQVTPQSTTTYTLSAEGGSSSATATVRVVVAGTSPSPSPSPSASPSPSPSPSASPSPSPSATPPGPSPLPSASPGGERSCGRPQGALAGCNLSVEWPSSRAASNECAQLTRIVAIPSCPVSVGMTRTITFDVFAQGQALSWRRAAGGSDSVFPASGSLVSGQNTVTTTAVVYDSTLVFEVVGAGGEVVMRFTMGHR